ncbi:tyrosine-type recombinase/integrase [Sphingomonadaceae bacterium jetA1]
MEMSEIVNASPRRPVWNAGRTVGAKRALKPKRIWEIRFYLNQRRRVRDRALFDLAIDSELRGCDLVRMKIGDVVSGGQIRTRGIVMQQKTGRPVQFELLPDARASLLTWLERRGGTVDDYIFPSRVDHDGHLSTRQYARLVDEWVTGVGLMRNKNGTHSLRRTKASIIYRATGKLRAVHILLGHSKIENTVRYLGIDIEDALALAENTEV